MRQDRPWSTTTRSWTVSSTQLEATRFQQRWRFRRTHKPCMEEVMWELALKLTCTRLMRTLPLHWKPNSLSITIAKRAHKSEVHCIFKNRPNLWEVTQLNSTYLPASMRNQSLRTSSPNQNCSVTPIQSRESTSHKFRLTPTRHCIRLLEGPVIRINDRIIAWGSSTRLNWSRTCKKMRRSRSIIWWTQHTVWRRQRENSRWRGPSRYPRRCSMVSRSQARSTRLSLSDLLRMQTKTRARPSQTFRTTTRVAHWLRRLIRVACQVPHSPTLTWFFLRAPRMPSRILSTLRRFRWSRMVSLSLLSKWRRPIQTPRCLIACSTIKAALRRTTQSRNVLRKATQLCSSPRMALKLPIPLTSCQHQLPQQLLSMLRPSKQRPRMQITIVRSSPTTNSRTWASKKDWVSKSNQPHPAILRMQHSHLTCQDCKARPICSKSSPIRLTRLWVGASTKTSQHLLTLTKAPRIASTWSSSSTIEVRQALRSVAAPWWRAPRCCKAKTRPPTCRAKRPQLPTNSIARTTL